RLFISMSVPLILLLVHCTPRALHSFPTRRSSDLSRADRHVRRAVAAVRCRGEGSLSRELAGAADHCRRTHAARGAGDAGRGESRSEEHTSELQSLRHLVCRLLLEKKKTK